MTTRLPLGTMRTLLVTDAAGKQHTAIYVRAPDRWVVGKTDPSLGWLWKCETEDVKAEMARRGMTYEWKAEEKTNA